MDKLIIIGSGPAGYTAGIYSSRAQLKPVLFSGKKPGGQLTNTTVVENWPGADEGVTGPQLMLKMKAQAVKFGTEVIDEAVESVDFTKSPFKVNNREAEAVIIATGADNILLNIPGEAELMGRGVAVCAVCDAPLYRGKIAAVIGGGDAAIEDALALAKFAKQVYLIVRRNELRASKIMQARVTANQAIKILWETEVKEIIGNNKVEAIKLTGGIRPLKTSKNDLGLKGIHPSEIDKSEVLKIDGVFLAIGHRPVTDIFKNKIELTEAGYIKTNFNNYPTMTSVAGVFAAGDCVDSRYRQAITAAGTGCQAALDAEKYLSNSA